MCTFLSVELGTGLVWASVCIAGKPCELSVNYSLVAFAQKISGKSSNIFMISWNKHFCFFTIICVALLTSWAAIPRLNWSNQDFFLLFLSLFFFQSIYFVNKEAILFFFLFFSKMSSCSFLSDSLVTWGIKALSPNNMESDNGTGIFIYFKITKFLILQNHLIRKNFIMFSSTSLA